ncbi:fumarylacetoacetate hydrolase family protein [Paracoccus contaminans]|uniref:Fumarylacetoacetase n=1 Tax=Paracoccus contaminans TaxID=1945662 RepID=A0A1W6CUP3_9RHOB|nr:fumarylacetoacetate hydrolase family protein [Paracoccus contaminans]ARJ68555.1 fumarylacetoacetase [Paracoccus contaminans]
MTDLTFPAPEWPALPVAGQGARFPVRRIFCVGRNYAAHAAEMGTEVDREAPFYFTKSALALVDSGSVLPYPPGTADLHHEMELVVALGATGFQLRPEDAMRLVFGYAAGLDMTRRDLQAAAKAKQRPWSLGKDFEGGAVIAPITPAADFGLPAGQRISLWVDGALRQDARLSDMVWTVPDLVADLSRFYHLSPGDVIFTGTPAGVGPVGPGARIRGEIEGLEPVTLTLADPD